MPRGAPLQRFCCTAPDDVRRPRCACIGVDRSSFPRRVPAWQAAARSKARRGRPMDGAHSPRGPVQDARRLCFVRRAYAAGDCLRADCRARCATGRDRDRRALTMRSVGGYPATWLSMTLKRAAALHSPVRCIRALAVGEPCTTVARWDPPTVALPLPPRNAGDRSGRVNALMAGAPPPDTPTPGPPKPPLSAPIPPAPPRD